MKKLIKIKNLYKQAEVKPFGKKIEIKENIAGIVKLKKCLEKIFYNFGDSEVRFIFLSHNENIPPKTSRCEESIWTLNSDNIKLEKIYFDNFEQEDMKMVSAFEINRIGAKAALDKVSEALNIINEFQTNNIPLSELTLSIKTDSENKKMSNDAIKILDKFSWKKTHLSSFIYEIQNFFKDISFKKTEIELEGELILNFYSSESFTSFKNGNNLKSNDFKLISSSLNNSISVVIDKNRIVNTDSLLFYTENISLNSPILNGIESIINKNINIQNPIKSNIWVGVLDSAISKHSIIFGLIDRYTSLIPQSFRDGIFHGEAVSSALLFGGEINGLFNDGCLSPKIHHYEIFHENIKLDQLISNIRQAISISSREIKIWNLSINAIVELAADEGVVSFFASELDKIQDEFGVIIIQSAGNKNQYNTLNRLTSPSDSLHSLVVSATNSLNGTNISSYSLKGYGKFLTRKPDVSHFGGESDLKIHLIENGNVVEKMGTSFSAPLVARKFAHIMSTKKTNILETKALIIHSAYFLSNDKTPSDAGWGIVPIDVNEIISTKSDEIRFIISCKTDYTKTYFGELKVVKDEERFNYSVYSTILTKPMLDSKYGAEYVRATIKPSLGPSENGEVIIPHRALQPFHENNEGDEVEYEKRLIEVFGKWKSSQCFKKEITHIPKLSTFENFIIKLKIDKRMSSINQKISLDNVVVVTFKHKNEADHFINFIDLNKNVIENINELNSDLNLTGTLKLK